jgi:hypothetical protein
MQREDILWQHLYTAVGRLPLRCFDSTCHGNRGSSGSCQRLRLQSLIVPGYIVGATRLTNDHWQELQCTASADAMPRGVCLFLDCVEQCREKKGKWQPQQQHFWATVMPTPAPAQAQAPVAAVATANPAHASIRLPEFKGLARRRGINLATLQARRTLGIAQFLADCVSGKHVGLRVHYRRWLADSTIAGMIESDTTAAPVEWRFVVERCKCTIESSDSLASDDSLQLAEAQRQKKRLRIKLRLQMQRAGDSHSHSRKRTTSSNRTVASRLLCLSTAAGSVALFRDKSASSAKIETENPAAVSPIASNISPGSRIDM